jgi:hypothetical protein
MISYNNMKLNTKTSPMSVLQFTNRLGPKVANGLKRMKHCVLQFRTPKHGFNL